MSTIASACGSMLAPFFMISAAQPALRCQACAAQRVVNPMVIIAYWSSKMHKTAPGTILGRFCGTLPERFAGLLAPTAGGSVIGNATSTTLWVAWAGACRDGAAIQYAAHAAKYLRCLP